MCLRPIAAFCAALLFSSQASAATTGLVVHEWGTFTSIAGDDGIALEWRPLSGSSDLPSFVYTFDQLDKGLRHIEDDFGGKGAIMGTVRMETPVVYFYADREMKVSTSVAFPRGKITEWYPRAKYVGPTAIVWGEFLVQPAVSGELKTEAEPSHYYPARATDADIIRMCSEQGNELEKFLFYRGVGSFPLPLKARLDGGIIHIDSAAGKVIIFENKSGRVGFRVAGGAPAVERPDLDSDLEPVIAELERMLVGEGLYPKEAKAMTATWRDSWFEEGLRVFYVLPRRATDELLPIRIDPQPDELVRVLVGRTELITPEMKAEVGQLAKDLFASEDTTREAARAKLALKGRFAEPVLASLIAGERDVVQRARLSSLIASVR